MLKNYEKISLLWTTNINNNQPGVSSNKRNKEQKFIYFSQQRTQTCKKESIMKWCGYQSKQ